MRSIPTFPIMKRIERHRLSARKPGRDILARRMLGIPIKFRVDTEIYGAGEPVEFVYEVVSGAVRTMKVLSDGRRKIGGFYFAGEIFGLEDDNEHSLSAQAVAASTVRLIKRRTLVQLAAKDRCADVGDDGP